jgi:RNA polymerase sigma-70 factor (ECF subfamily)
MELARAAAAGDVSATRKLLEAVAPRLVRVVRVVLGAAHPDVDDVVQQALIALVQALPAFRGECEPIHYASRIALRAAVAARKQSRAGRARRDESVELETIAGSSDQPPEIARAARRRKLVLDLVGQLSEEQAETLALRFVLGWSLEEVARSTSVPVNTVRSRLRLAKEALRKKIEADPALAEELEVDA